MPTWLTELPARVVMRRQAIVYWMAVAVLVAAATATLLRTTRSAEAAIERWGPGHHTAVAARDLPAGHRVAVGDIDIVRLPAAARPPSALPDAPLGSTLRTEVFAGEALTAGRVGPVDESGVAAATPAGHRGVAVARTAATPPVAPGDRVELRATTLDEAGSVVGTIAGTGPVVDAGDEVLVVAVPNDRVDAVVEAIAYGEIVVVVVPGRERLSGTT